MRAAVSEPMSVGKASGPFRRGAHAGLPTTAPVYTRLRHWPSVKISTRKSSEGELPGLWLPFQTKAGIIACAGELGLPFEKTFETVPTSWSSPFVTTGFVDA